MRNNPAKAKIIKKLQEIPGVGRSIAEDLWLLGIYGVTDLQYQVPEALYRRLETMKGHRQDRCLLYVLYCAVYYASHAQHDPELLKWWNWKNRTN